MQRLPIDDTESHTSFLFDFSLLWERWLCKSSVRDGNVNRIQINDCFVENL